MYIMKPEKGKSIMFVINTCPRSNESKVRILVVFGTISPKIGKCLRSDLANKRKINVKGN